MDFKKCSQCGNKILATNEKCPYCGGNSFVDINTLNANSSEKERDSEITTPGGSIALGIVLGFFLGMIGFLIACISNSGKEHGNTLIGTVIGVLAQCAVILIIVFSAMAFNNNDYID